MDGNRTEGGRVTVRRVDVRGAAEALDISAEAVRKRIARNTLPHEKDDRGNVWVLLEEREDSDRTEDGHREDGREDASISSLISRMEDEISYLRSELDRRGEEIGRRDAIIMQLSQANSEMARTVRELEAPRGERESPVTASEERGNGDVPEGEKRSWWRRMFGG
jgi:hypothetical protein